MTVSTPFAEFRMAGHVAIVTGGAQNIGEAIARTFSGAGAKVMIADLNGDKAAETAQTIAAETGGEVRGIGCDVTEADIERCRRRDGDGFRRRLHAGQQRRLGRAYDDPWRSRRGDGGELQAQHASAHAHDRGLPPHLLEAENATITNSGRWWACCRPSTSWPTPRRRRR